MGNLYYKMAKSAYNEMCLSKRVIDDILKAVDNYYSEYIEEFLGFRSNQDGLVFDKNVEDLFTRAIIYEVSCYDDWIKEIDDQTLAIVNQMLTVIFADSPFTFMPVKFHIEKANDGPIKLYFGKITTSLGHLCGQHDERFPKTSETTRKFIDTKKEIDAQIKEKEKELIDIMIDGYRKKDSTEYSVIDEFFKGVKREIFKISLEPDSINEKSSKLTIKIIDIDYQNLDQYNAIKDLFGFHPFLVTRSLKDRKILISCTRKKSLMDFYYQMLQAAMYNEPEEPGTKRTRVSPQTKKSD